MSKKILLIDDEDAIIEVTRVTLETLAGWTVITAASGPEGVARAQTEQPDAILLDVMMPEMDGPCTLKELKADPQTQNLPVIFLTAKVQAADIRRYQELGAQGAIAKPYDPLRLACEIESVLGWAAAPGFAAVWEE